MASAALPVRKPCTHCAKLQKSGAETRLRYLDLHPICLHELPSHPDTADVGPSRGPTLGEFLNGVLVEAFEVQFDGDAWTPHGEFPHGKDIYVSMPALREPKNIQLDHDIRVPCEVKKQVNGTWLARTSEHSASQIRYSELDSLLAQDHCRKEAEFTPSVFDANELLRWSEADLKKAVADLRPEWQVKSVQMSIYQMFHEMPKVLGASLLHQRVFHVLCITAHSTHDFPGESVSRSQSNTLQLPISLDSFRDCQTVMNKSRYRPDTKIYNITQNFKLESDLSDRQRKYLFKKFTEGIYVSLERLFSASNTDNPLKDRHRWDMMTKSDARGITRFAPWSIQKKETLEAVAKDVLYVLEQIRRQRRDAQSGPVSEVQ